MVLVSIALAGCPGTPKGKPPARPQVVITPSTGPTPWWTAGDAACPSLVGQPIPGGAPGTSITMGHVVGSPAAGWVYCAAGGIAHGPTTRFHPGGRPAETGTMDRGRRTGTWTSWHANGQLQSNGAYADNERVGMWSTWYPSGSPRDRGEWRLGHRAGIWLQWEDGQSADADADTFTEYHTGSGDVTSEGVVRGDELKTGKPLCILGVAYPLCRIIVLGDLGIHWDADHDAGSSSVATIQLGGIINLTRRHAIGGTFGWRFDADYPATIAESRYRYWLHDYVAAEIGVGLITPRGDHPGGKRPGQFAHGALVFADALDLVATIEYQPIEGGGGEFVALAGVRFGLPSILTAIYIAGSLLEIAK